MITRDFCGDGSLLDYISVNILILILYYNFAKCYHWRKLGKENMRSIFFFPDNCMRIYNFLKINILIKKKLGDVIHYIFLVQMNEYFSIVSPQIFSMLSLLPGLDIDLFEQKKFFPQQFPLTQLIFFFNLSTLILKETVISLLIKKNKFNLPLQRRKA